MKILTADGAEVDVLIGLAPRGWTARRVAQALRTDPFQTRTSLDPIILTHPRTGKQKVLSEFVEDLVGDQRFGIETQDAVILVSRLQNSAIGTVYVPVGVIHVKESAELLRGHKK